MIAPDLLAAAPPPHPHPHPHGWTSLFPLVETWYWQAAVVIAAFALALALSGRIVMALVGPGPPPSPSSPSIVPPAPKGPNAGAVIGKCENLLIITLVLMGEYQGLGLVLAAKSIARIEAVKENASYYLGGTLVNLVWSVAVGLAARLIVVGV